MSIWAKLALALSFVLFLTVSALAVFIWLTDPTLRGLRPHGVHDNLSSYSIPDLVASSEHPPVRAVLVRDAWYERQGGTGWVLFEGEALQDEALTFAVSGGLDTALARIFKPEPVRCNDTGTPEKAVIAYEPEHRRSGFTGRSTCRRAKMDVRALMEQGTPVRFRAFDRLTHREFQAILARPDVLPFSKSRPDDSRAFSRLVKLPIHPTTQATENIELESALRRELREMSWPAGITWALSMQELVPPREASEQDSAAYYILKVGEQHYALDHEAVTLWRAEVTFTCALSAEEACAKVFPPVSALNLVRRTRGEQLVARLVSLAEPTELADERAIYDTQLAEDRMIDFLLREATYNAEWFERR